MFFSSYPLFAVFVLELFIVTTIIRLPCAGRRSKWLDLESLVESILEKKYRKNEILSTKYYTAHVSGVQDKTKPYRQNAFLRALELHPRSLKIVYGKFLIVEGYRPTVDSKELVKVYLPEEKGSDVNLAVHMVFEATQDLYDVAVVVTNDTDMREAFRIVSEELKKKIILVQPQRVKTANSLSQYCFDVLKFKTDDLISNQLPNTVGPNIRRPDEWK